MQFGVLCIEDKNEFFGAEAEKLINNKTLKELLAIAGTVRPHT